MPKFLKTGKVVILLSGRYAGRKAVVVRSHDEGTKDRPYGHAIVVGIARYPLRVTKDMGKKKQEKRARMKPFIKAVNFNHIMPTRYTLDLDFKTIVTTDIVANPTARLKARKDVKKMLQERFATGKNRWFFQKLRF